MFYSYCWLCNSYNIDGNDYKYTNVKSVSIEIYIMGVSILEENVDDNSGLVF